MENEVHQTMIVQISDIYKDLLDEGKVHNKKDFATLLDVDYIGLIKAMNGNKQYLTKSLLAKAIALKNNPEMTSDKEILVPLLPTGARAGTLADFALAVQDYDVEKIVSPIKGADYAIQITGTSMAPEYEPGCHVLIKKIFEEQFIEWGKTYVLDTDNGAVVKRIYPTDDSTQIECRSVNPDFPPFRILKEHVRGWYRVLMVLALK